MSFTYQLRQALALLEEAIARDPHYGPALGLAAQCCQHLATNLNTPDRDAIRSKGIEFGRRAVEVAGDDPRVLACFRVIGSSTGMSSGMLHRM
jgi:hypothetical protein